ncbi:TRAP transporter substrate-binding protein [Natribacillus halophilus]|uniref:TRAP-type C4-dicarboxylate transport system, substrate-binding protein n=1 Tax=Natribacillus halophilus TaxID=549003 RepID=A0A1G8MWB0_9BACI|nr:TRAP transporter substrate-binding protein [Natribacillus halophilus]SDI72308.1 TRAP-type C4-dicarboxylate transport system, substrate-binding protein [Natribacillus halophilus]
MKKGFVRNSTGLIMLSLFVLLLTACGAAEESSGEDGDADQDEQESMDLVFSHFQPANHPIQTEVLDGLDEDLNEQTDGRINMEFYADNTLGDPESHYDMTVSGEADIGLSVYGYAPGSFDLVTVMELPFLAESAEHASEILMTLYEEFPELQEEHDDTHPLFLYSAEPAQIMSNDYRIETPEDIEGLRVRSPSPLANDIIESMGATAVSMPMGDVYEALDRGVIDAAMVPLETLYNYSFHEVVEYITIGNFSATPFFSVMNQNTYDGIGDSDQEVLDSLTGKELATEAGSVYDEDGEAGLDAAIDSGAEIIELEGDTLEPWEEALEPVVGSWLEERESEGYDATELYERAMELRDELSGDGEE